MTIIDQEIMKTLYNGGYIRRKFWREKKACYHLAKYDIMEFGYLTDGKFEVASEEADALGMAYGDIFSNDWEVMK